MVWDVIAKVATGIEIAGTIFGASNQRKAGKHDAETARIRAEYEPQLILEQAEYQAQVLRRQAAGAAYTSAFTQQTRQYLKQFSERKVNTTVSNTQDAINRRSAFAANRIARNNAITDENRKLLFNRLGYAAQDLGEQAGDIFAAEEVRQSGSGFSTNSVSFHRVKYEQRRKLKDRLSKLHEEHEQSATILLDTNYYNNRNLLEQTYIENEGMIDNAESQIADIRESAFLQDNKLAHDAWQLNNDIIALQEREAFTLDRAEKQAEYTRVLAERGAFPGQQAASTAYIEAGLNIGSTILNRII